MSGFKSVRLTEEQQRALANFQGDVEGFEPVGEQELGMDHHGVMQMITVVKCSDEKLRAFRWEQTSEDLLFEGDGKLLEVTPKEVVVTQYDRKDGKDWWD